MVGFNLNYLIFMLPGLILSLWAQAKVQGAYRKWGQVRNYSNLTGMDTAEQLLPRIGLSDVSLARTRGTLSDFYDPGKNTLNLSQGVADQPSVAAMAVTAHELGHALQKKEGYALMRVRSAIVPVVNLGSSLGIILILIGLVLSFTPLAYAGLVLFGTTTVFSLVTLPVELNASERARAMLAENGLVANDQERQGVDQVLSAAAWTYVAGLATSILQLLYFVSLVGGGSRRRRF